VHASACSYGMRVPMHLLAVSAAQPPFSITSGTSVAFVALAGMQLQQQRQNTEAEAEAEYRKSEQLQTLQVTASCCKAGVQQLVAQCRRCGRVDM
jgi:hypothetical protein